MKTYFIKTAVCAVLLAGGIQFASAEIRPLNGIAAEVNGYIITYGEISRVAEVLGKNAGQSIPVEQLLQAARQNLMERALMIDAARMQGLKATAEEIDTEIARRAGLGNATVEDVYADAASSGWSREQYRLEVAKDLLIERMMEGLEESIKITDHQVDEYLINAEKSGQNIPEGNPYTVYQVRRIILGINENNTVSSVGKRMALIARAVQQGNDFAALARRYSQEPAASEGGMLELTDRTEPAKVEQFLQVLEPGQTSMPIQTSRNWQMIQMVAKRTENDPVKVRREAVRRMLLQQEQQKLMQQFLGQLQQNAVIREY